jgi:ATP-dependent 26S proteasome regulatory subunit
MAMRSVFVIMAGVAGGVIIAGVVLWFCLCRWAERKTTEVVAGAKAATAEVSAKLKAASDESSKQDARRRAEREEARQRELQEARRKALRQWQLPNGNLTEAWLQEVKQGGAAIVRTSDNRRLFIRITDFTKDDQAYIRRWLAADGDPRKMHEDVQFYKYDM